MAGTPLTTAATVRCPHGFGITFASTATLRAGGAPVVRQVDLLQTRFECAVQQPCVTIAGSELSAVLRDAGSPIVLSSGLKTNIAECQVVDAGHDALRTE